MQEIDIVLHTCPKSNLKPTIGWFTGEQTLIVTFPLLLFFPTSTVSSHANYLLPNFLSLPFPVPINGCCNSLRKLANCIPSIAL